MITMIILEKGKKLFAKLFLLVPLVFQHVSAGPQPIFGLAMGLRGLGAGPMEHAPDNYRGGPGGEL